MNHRFWRSLRSASPAPNVLWPDRPSGRTPSRQDRLRRWGDALAIMALSLGVSAHAAGEPPPNGPISPVGSQGIPVVAPPQPGGASATAVPAATGVLTLREVKQLIDDLERHLNSRIEFQLGQVATTSDFARLQKILKSNLETASREEGTSAWNVIAPAAFGTLAVLLAVFLAVRMLQGELRRLGSAHRASPADDNAAYAEETVRRLDKMEERAIGTEAAVRTLERTVLDSDAQIKSDIEGRQKDINVLIQSLRRDLDPRAMSEQFLRSLKEGLESALPQMVEMLAQDVSTGIIADAAQKKTELDDCRRKLDQAQLIVARTETELTSLRSSTTALKSELDAAMSLARDHQACSAGLRTQCEAAQVKIVELQTKADELVRAEALVSRLRTERDELKSAKGSLEARIQVAEAAAAMHVAMEDPGLEAALRGIDTKWHENGALRGVYHACCALFQAAERRHHEMAREWIAGVDRAIVAAGGGDDRRIEGLRAALVDVINQRIQGCYRIEWPKVGTEFLPKRHVPEGPRGLSIAKVLSAVILSPSGDVVALARVQTV